MKLIRPIHSLAAAAILSWGCISAVQAADPDTNDDTTENSNATDAVTVDESDGGEDTDAELQAEPGPFWSVLPNRNPELTATGSPAIFGDVAPNNQTTSTGVGNYSFPSSPGIFLGSGFGFGRNNSGAGAGAGGGGGGGSGGGGGGGNGGGDDTDNGDEDPDKQGGVFTDPSTPSPSVPPVPPTHSDPNCDPSAVPDSSTGTPTGTPVVPEPGSMLMLAIGGAVGGVHWYRRRRKTGLTTATVE